MYCCLQPGNAPPPGFNMPADAGGDGDEGEYDPDAPEEPTVQGQLAPEVCTLHMNMSQHHQYPARACLPVCLTKPHRHCINFSGTGLSRYWD